MAKINSISSFGIKILRKLGRQEGGRILSDGRGIAGSQIFPKSLMNDFLKNDLVLVVDPHKIVLTEPGKKFIRRRLHMQKQAKNPSSPYPANPYQAQHANFKLEVTGHGNKIEKKVKNIGNIPLSWLMKRKDKSGKPFLSQDHIAAGEKLSRDFEYSGSLPRTTGFYDGVPIGGKSRGRWQGLNPTDRQLAAKRRVNAALDHVGPGLSDILIRVCCFNEGLEQAEKELAWPSRSGKLVLKIALDRLVDHYNPKNNQYG